MNHKVVSGGESDAQLRVPENARKTLTYENSATDIDTSDIRDTSTMLKDGAVKNIAKPLENHLVKDTVFDSFVLAKAKMPSIQSRVYNFLERPTGWKCFVYHFTV